MALLELWQQSQIRSDSLDPWELVHVHAEALCIVHLWHQEHISQSQNVPKAVFRTSPLKGFFELCEAPFDGEDSPAGLMVLTEP